MPRPKPWTLTSLASSLLTRRTLARGGGAGMVAAGATLFAGQHGATSQVATPAASPAPDGSLIVRPNAASLSTAQKTAYVDAVLALKEKPSPWVPGLSTYDTFVAWHRDAFVCGVNAAHMGPAFFPWHRMFLHLFESQLREVDPSVILPYWDWTVDNGVDSYVWQDDFMGGDGSDADDEAVMTGPFRKGAWTITVFDYTDPLQIAWLTRDLGRGGLAPDLPTSEQVEAALAISEYDAEPWSSLSPIASSFRNTIEGWRDCVDQYCDPLAGAVNACTGDHMIHNRVHLWVAGEFAFAHEAMMSGMDHASATPVAGAEEILGTMAANSSPNDPVFFQHHANIDRIWNLWLARHGQTYLPESGGPVGHNIDDDMWPYHEIGLEITPRMMLDSRSLGYIYDTDA
jgi:tyrosinase